MNHLHFPDGILPVWLWLSGLIIVAIYLLGLGIYLRKNKFNKKLALTGVFVALMIIAMSIEIIPPVYHLNLAVLTGIILGPVFSVLCMFVVNIFLALIGHGGITLIGLNTICLSVEAIVAYFCFKLLFSKTKKAFVSAFITTFIALIIGVSTSLGVVYLGTGDINKIIHTHSNAHSELHNENQHHTDKHETKHAEEIEHKHSHEIEGSNNLENHMHTDKADNITFDIKRFIIIIITLGLLGWVIEAFITGFIVKYLYKIKPDLFE